MDIRVSQEFKEDHARGVSVVSVAQRALGDPAAVTCSAAFALQMLAVVTAQVAKCGEPRPNMDQAVQSRGSLNSLFLDSPRG